MNEAKIINGAIVIQTFAWYDGELVLETVCRDYEHYKSLPNAVIFQGIECGKTGWSSDHQYACYKSGAYIAHIINKSI